MSVSKYCHSCGTSIDQAARFCPACGAEQAIAESSAGTSAPKGSRRWRIALIVGGGVIALLVVLYIIGTLTEEDETGGDAGGGTNGNVTAVAGEDGFQVAEVYESYDPLDPMLSRVEFVPSDGQPVEAIEVFGSKAESGSFPETGLVYLEGLDEPMAVDLDEAGRPDEVRMPGGLTLKFEFDSDTVLMHYLTPSGEFGVESGELTPDIREALDGLVSEATAARAPTAPVSGYPMVSADPAGMGGSPRSAPAPVPPTGPDEAMDADVNLQAVRRVADVVIRAEDESGQDISKAICCFNVSSSGEQHASHQVIRNDQGLFVRIIHEVPVETVLSRIDECQGPNWWLVGVLLAMTVLSSIFGAPILVALGVGEIEAGIFAGIGIPLISGIGIFEEATQPTCVELVTAKLQQEYRNREATVEICPVSFQLVDFDPPCRTGTYRPWDPDRANFLGDLVFTARVRDDLDELEVCSQGSGTSDPTPRFAAEIGSINQPPPVVTGPPLPVSYFAPPGFTSGCGAPVVENGGEPTEPPSTGQTGYYAIQVLSFSNMTLAVRSVEQVESGELANCNFLHGGLCGPDDPPAEMSILAGPFETSDEARAWLCERMTNIHPPPLAAGLVADFQGQTVSTEVGC